MVPVLLRAALACSLVLNGRPAELTGGAAMACSVWGRAHPEVSEAAPASVLPRGPRQARGEHAASKRSPLGHAGASWSCTTDREAEPAAPPAGGFLPASGANLAATK